MTPQDNEKMLDLFGDASKERQEATDYVGDMMHAETQAVVDEGRESRKHLLEDLRTLRERVVGVEASTKEATELIKKNNSDTAELLDILRTVKGGIKVLGWMGGAAKWVASVVAAFAGIYAIVQNIRGNR